MATNQTPTDLDALLSLVRRLKENCPAPPPATPKRDEHEATTAIEALNVDALKVSDVLPGDETLDG
jgi:hypothetical protein